MKYLKHDVVFLSLNLHLTLLHDIHLKQNSIAATLSTPSPRVIIMMTTVQDEANELYSITSGILRSVDFLKSLLRTEYTLSTSVLQITTDKEIICTNVAKQHYLLILDYSIRLVHTFRITWKAYCTLYSYVSIHFVLNIILLYRDKSLLSGRIRNVVGLNCTS